MRNFLFIVLGISCTLGMAQAATLYVGTCTSTQGAELNVEWCWGDDKPDTLYTSFGTTYRFTLMQTTHNIATAFVDERGSGGVWQVAFRASANNWTLDSHNPKYNYVGTCQETLPPITGAASHTICDQHITKRSLKAGTGG